MKIKQRLDVSLVERGMAESREKAKALIMSGIVYVNNQKSDKAGFDIKPEDVIEVRGKKIQFVSRGGLKLEKAVKSFGFTLRDLVCMDVGASTGGFTDCMLQSGAKRVYAVDVGYGQLAWKLRCDERVINLERTNIRYVTEEQIPEQIDFASVDVSFISLTLVLPVIHKLLRDGGAVVCLIKPQFEAGKGKVGKNGVVREPSVHFDTVKKITSFMTENGFDVRGIDYSPVKGPEGNIEYLAYAEKSESTAPVDDGQIEEIISQSHTLL